MSSLVSDYVVEYMQSNLDSRGRLGSSAAQRMPNAVTQWLQEREITLKQAKWLNEHNADSIPKLKMEWRRSIQV